MKEINYNEIKKVSSSCPIILELKNGEKFTAYSFEFFCDEDDTDFNKEVENE